MQYPTSIALLIATAPRAEDAAQSRATLAGAIAVVPGAALLGCAAAGLGGYLVRDAGV